MTETQRIAIRKGIEKALAKGLGIAETIELIETYEEILSETITATASNRSSILPPSLEAAQGYMSEYVAEKIRVENINGPYIIKVPDPPPPPLISLSATNAISSKPAERVRDLDSAYQEMTSRLPSEVSVELSPGKPTKFWVTPYRKEANRERNIPASLGFSVSAYGDRSQVVSRVAFNTNDSLEVEKHLAECLNSIKAVHDSRMSGVRSTAPPAINMPAELMNVKLDETLALGRVMGSANGMFVASEPQV